MPASWRRVLRRRRGGIPGTPVEINDRAAEKVRQWTERAAARTAQAVDDPNSDRQEHELAAIWIMDRPDGYGRRDDEDPLRFGGLDPVMASEVIAALTELTS